MNPVYFFDRPPPHEPKLFFAERDLVTTMLFAPPPRQRTLPGCVGRWNMHTGPLTLKNPWEDGGPWRLVGDQLPGVQMRYEDWDTGQSWIWVLTDQTICQGAMRLGVWPD